MNLFLLSTFWMIVMILIVVVAAIVVVADSDVQCAIVRPLNRPQKYAPTGFSTESVDRLETNGGGQGQTLFMSG